MLVDGSLAPILFGSPPCGLPVEGRHVDSAIEPVFVSRVEPPLEPCVFSLETARRLLAELFLVGMALPEGLTPMSSNGRDDVLS